MKLTSISTSSIVAATTLASALAGTTEPIITPEASAAPSAWEFRIEPYGWLTALEGTVGARNQTGSLDAGFDDVFDVLDMAAALQFEARYGRWGFIADGFYAELSQNFTPPTNLHRNGNFEMEQFIGEFYAAYRFTESPSGFIDAYAGVRYNYLSVDISALPTFPLGAPINASQSKHWIDPLIGLRGQWDINEKWFLAGKGDVGGFGVSSDLTWSLQATFGYNFTENVSAELGYRYLSTDYSEGGFRYDINQSGLFTGLSIRF